MVCTSKVKWTDFSVVDTTEPSNMDTLLLFRTILGLLGWETTDACNFWFSLLSGNLPWGSLFSTHWIKLFKVVVYVVKNVHQSKMSLYFKSKNNLVLLIFLPYSNPCSTAKLLTSLARQILQPEWCFVVFLLTLVIFQCSE